ncbi:MAG TPA: divalent metal cation transporter [Candidatus Eisenbacteria bacterium]|nr:divalent metal cation transporter [Candidatus Eisenbacteria bacterium]
MNKWLGVTLGLLTAIGGFVDVAALATAAAAGAKFQLGLVWAFVLGTLAIILLLEMAGRYASVSRRPYSGAIRQHLGFKYYMLPLAACLIANVLMLPAEMGGMAVALSLVLGVNWFVLYPVAALFVWLCAWFGSFKLIENVPALLGLVTLSFIAGVIALGGPRPALLTTLWHPDVAGQVPGYLFLAAAILGAIISPYLVVFYSSGAREEGWSITSLGVNRVTAIGGMAFGCLAALGILLLSSMTLGPMHVQVGTLGEVGLALARPFGTAGAYLFAGTLFVTCWGAALEITLAMSYNISQGFGWSWGIDRPHRHAARFRLTMLLFLALAFCVGLLGLDPLTLTIYASAVTALILPISLFPFLVVMNNPKYLGDRVNGRPGNLATVGVLLLAFVLAVVSIPLFVVTGGQA